VIEVGRFSLQSSRTNLFYGMQKNNPSDKEKEKTPSNGAGAGGPAWVGAGNSRPKGQTGGNPGSRQRNNKNRYQRGAQHKKGNSKTEALAGSTLNAMADAQGSADARVDKMKERCDEALARVEGEKEALQKQIDKIVEKTRVAPEPEDLTWSYEQGGFDAYYLLMVPIAILLFFLLEILFLMVPITWFFGGQIGAFAYMTSVLMLVYMLHRVCFYFINMARSVRWVVFPTKVYWQIMVDKQETINSTDDTRVPGLSAVDMVYNDPKIVLAERVSVPGWLVFTDELSMGLGEMVRKWATRRSVVRISYTLFCAFRTHALADLKVSDVDAEHNINVAMKRVAYVNCDPQVLARHNYHFHTVKLLVEKLRSERQEAVKIYGNF